MGERRGAGGAEGRKSRGEGERKERKNYIVDGLYLRGRTILCLGNIILSGIRTNFSGKQSYSV